MDQVEISKASQASYEAYMQQRQQAQDFCDDDLSPEEKKKRKEFDRARAATYTGQWPARQK